MSSHLSIIITIIDIFCHSVTSSAVDVLVHFVFILKIDKSSINYFIMYIRFKADVYDKDYIAKK